MAREDPNIGASEEEEPMNSLSGFAKMMSSPEPSGDSENCTSENSRPSENESLSFKRHKAKNTKICGVCGDRALGYNFNAVTCESCKAFFRRNAFKDKQIKCLFKGDCIIDLRTRRFCPACRIKKCFEIGMKRDMILDENERKARMAKVLQNRVKKTSVQSTPNADIKSEPLDPDEYRVLIIFNPDGNNLIDRELISNLQDKYINILKHYLEAQYSYEHAHEYFAAILDRLSELKSVGEEHSRILLQVNPCQIEPLMLEVLNLK
ncbi:hypothetical protein C0Q70_08861 [Pomacea canaliculata]|uniref:Nuclear receptor domain-containing protein n=1 Tax=Pomacea canaliculata TaxID=400727 RepID=A0A2T7P886_POMCA|nr:hypothetical protein C0Q70_08861 [Pomacea canaliculata]